MVPRYSCILSTAVPKAFTPFYVNFCLDESVHICPLQNLKSLPGVIVFSWRDSWDELNPFLDLMILPLIFRFGLIWLSCFVSI